MDNDHKVLFARRKVHGLHGDMAICQDARGEHLMLCADLSTTYQAVFPTALMACFYSGTYYDGFFESYMLKEA